MSLIGLFVVFALTGVGLARVVVTFELWLDTIQHHPSELGRVALVFANFASSGLGIVWMLRRDRRTPNLMLGYYAMQTIITIYVVLQLEPNGGSEAYRAGYVLGGWMFPLRGVAWILYFRRSALVKATFVR